MELDNKKRDFLRDTMALELKDREVMWVREDRI